MTRFERAISPTPRECVARLRHMLFYSARPTLPQRDSGNEPIGRLVELAYTSLLPRRVYLVTGDLEPSSKVV